MKNIKLALLCLALSNVLVIRAMEQQEEHEFHYYDEHLRQQESSQNSDDHMSYGEKEKEYVSHATPNFEESFTGLLQQLSAFSLSQESQNYFQTVEDFFKEYDIYTALIKSIELIQTLDSNWNQFDDISLDTQELLHFIVKKISTIENISSLFHQAVEDTLNRRAHRIPNNDSIKAILICSRGNISKWSVDTFYSIFKKLNFSLRTLDDENKVMLPYLSNVHPSLWLSILKLQAETNYSLFNIHELTINAFLLGKKEIIQYLVFKNFLATNDISKAVLAGNLEYLQNIEFDINQLDRETGLSLLGFAAINGSLEIATLLLKKGADVNLAYPLHVAAFFGSTEIAYLLLRAGAHLQVKCNFKFFRAARAIDMALHGKHYLLAKTLLAAELATQATPVQEEQRATFQDSLLAEDSEIAETILASYPTCFPATYLSKSSNFHNLTPLHIAVQHNWINLIKTLLSNGINLDTRTSKFGNTPLHIATNLGYYEIIKLLLEAGARADIKDSYGLTALDLIKLTFAYGETYQARRNAIKAFKLLRIASKEHLNPFSTEDNPANSVLYGKKRHQASLTLRSSDYIKNKTQKTKLTKKIQSTEKVPALKDINIFD